MTAKTVKRLAADLLGVGESRVRIKEGELGRAEEALTREDVRGLIADGAVYALPKKGPRKKPEGRKRSRGSRKGTKHSRKPKKEAWMEKVRAQRKYLEELAKKGEIGPEDRRFIYLKVKGGSFRGKKALYTYLEENGMLKEVKEKKAEEK